MNTLHTIVPMFLGFGVFLFVVAAFIHMLVFGTLFGLIVRKIASASSQQDAQAAKHCDYCGATLSPGNGQCPGCGAKP